MAAPAFSDLRERFLEARPNPFARALAKARAAGRPLTDLVGPPWGDTGLVMPGELIAQAYAEALDCSHTYRPDAMGRLDLREAIAAWYRLQGLDIAPDDIVVTPGTSLAYALVFRCLATAGAEVLCPAPSYPLFDDIAAACGLTVAAYRLFPPRGDDGHHRLDAHEVELCLSTRTRAVCVVSPHNPTGAVASSDELRALEAMAHRHHMPIVFDEVFEPFRPGASGPLLRPAAAPLTFLLNGFSKMLAMPGHKIGWIAMTGTDASARAQARQLIEHLADTYLATSDVAMAAAAHLLRDLLAGGPTAKAQRRLVAEVERRQHLLRSALMGCGVWPGPVPDAGVYAVVPLPAHLDEEAVAMAMLERGFVVHPGYYYHLSPHHLVLTCLAQPDVFEPAAHALSGILSA